uniref:Uncharacterized protein n=1 Tax=Geladintestivirus 1 TaxID=3233133 RepID=A0AAU8MIB8_9CAUD
MKNKYKVEIIYANNETVVFAILCDKLTAPRAYMFPKIKIKVWQI